MVIPTVVFGSAGAFLLVDYFTGPAIRFPIMYMIPVCLAAWQWRRSMALFLAMAMPVVRLWFNYDWHGRTLGAAPFINASIECAMLVGSALLIARLVAQQHTIRILRGTLPICSFCKKIRDPERNWLQLEDYITKKSEAAFTHTLCPECARKYYPEIFDSEISSSRT